MKFMCSQEPIEDRVDIVEIEARNDDEAAEKFARQEYAQSGGFEWTDVYVQDEDGEEAQFRATVEIVEQWTVSRVGP